VAASAGDDDGFRLEAQEPAKTTAKPKKTRRKRAEADKPLIRIPEDWEADDECVNYALKKGFSAEES